MKSLIHKETALLHPNPTVVEVTGIWVRMLLGLIKREKDSEISAIYKGMKEKLESESIGWGRFLTNTYPINAKKEHIGWSKIAIGLGFETLSKITAQKQMQLNEQTYMQHIQEVLSRGGDTDTNAAIVGGMLGALVGFKKLPKEYIKKMMEVRFELNPRIARRENRPFFYEPRAAFANAFTIIRKWFPKGKL
jgi:ADP-ribosylglycohydrolase